MTADKWGNWVWDFTMWIAQTIMMKYLASMGVVKLSRHCWCKAMRPLFLVTLVSSKASSSARLSCVRPFARLGTVPILLSWVWASQEGCCPQALPNRLDSVHSPRDTKQQQWLTGPVRVQASKTLLYSLEELALRSQLAASFQRPKWPALIYFGAPLGLANPTKKFTMNKIK